MLFRSRSAGHLCSLSRRARPVFPAVSVAYGRRFRHAAGAQKTAKSGPHAPRPTSMSFGKTLEATPGIEPGYADLQSAASPLRHVASDPGALRLVTALPPSRGRASETLTRDRRTSTGAECGTREGASRHAPFGHRTVPHDGSGVPPQMGREKRRSGFPDHGRGGQFAVWAVPGGPARPYTPRYGDSEHVV